MTTKSERHCIMDPDVVPAYLVVLFDFNNPTPTGIKLKKKDVLEVLESKEFKDRLKRGDVGGSYCPGEAPPKKWLNLKNMYEEKPLGLTLLSVVPVGNKVYGLVYPSGPKAKQVIAALEKAIDENYVLRLTPIILTSTLNSKMKAWKPDEPRDVHGILDFHLCAKIPVDYCTRKISKRHLPVLFDEVVQSVKSRAKTIKKHRAKTTKG